MKRCPHFLSLSLLTKIVFALFVDLIDKGIKMLDKKQLAPVPMGLVRSALFGTARFTGERIESGSIAAHHVLGTKIAYKGPRLNQLHAIVWQSILLLTREQGSCVVRVSGDRLIDMLGMSSRSGTNRDLILQRLEDLVGATVRYQTDTHRYFGTMLVGALRHEKTGHFEIEINPKVMDLLGNEVICNDLERKVALGKNQLALWLHDYISSHKVIYPISVEELRVLSGSEKELKKFRYELKRSMAIVSTGNGPLVKSWAINGDDKLTAEKGATKVVLIPKSADMKIAQDRKRNLIDQARNQRVNPL
ncbi:hypothetical protein Q7W57_15180 [Stenotrophomonas geniculata]|uniref:Uncharacterized protein n=1 Tax=Stenotrophomonas geniculata TaxID=86188 RepID=A0AAP5C5F8_9GAMM|nr:hypothetical protein [Stenotrophomonas geniculata]MDP4309741.1 hypothetical protein [Stenotrophomonas geniculata]MDQ7953123.1 hypothetical protein [Stenotrophomonas geniculata]